MYGPTYGPDATEPLCGVPGAPDVPSRDVRQRLPWCCLADFVVVAAVMLAMQSPWLPLLCDRKEERASYCVCVSIFFPARGSVSFACSAAASFAQPPLFLFFFLFFRVEHQWQSVVLCLFLFPFFLFSLEGVWRWAEYTADWRTHPKEIATTTTATKKAGWVVCVKKEKSESLWKKTANAQRQTGAHVADARKIDAIGQEKSTSKKSRKNMSKKREKSIAERRRRRAAGSLSLSLSLSPKGTE